MVVLEVVEVWKAKGRLCTNMGVEGLNPQRAFQHLLETKPCRDSEEIEGHTQRCVVAV